MALNTNLTLCDGHTISFDCKHGIDLSQSYFSEPANPDVFGLPSEKKQRLLSAETHSVNVDTVHICCHNNRTHSESAKHIFPDGVNVSDIPNVTNNAFYGCVVLSVDPSPIHKLSSVDRYDCGAAVDKVNDRMVTKKMIQTQLNKVKDRTHLPLFFKQCIFIRINDSFVASKDWPFLSNDAIHYLYDEFSFVFGINLCSVDRMQSPKTPNHRIWFNNNPNSQRLIIEGLSVPRSVCDGAYVLNLQLTPFANTDAVPTRPIIYTCAIKRTSKL